MSEWRYSIGGTECGPVTAEVLKGLADQGVLSPNDLVWKPGLKSWVEAKKVSGLFASDCNDDDSYIVGSASKSAAVSPPDSTKACPYCAEQIAFAAKKCRFCGEFLDPSLRWRNNSTGHFSERKNAAIPEKSDALAGCLGFLLGPVGLWYKGQWAAGFAWLIMGILITFATSGFAAPIFWIGMGVHAMVAKPKE